MRQFARSHASLIAKVAEKKIEGNLWKKFSREHNNLEEDKRL